MTRALGQDRNEDREGGSGQVFSSSRSPHFSQNSCEKRPHAEGKQLHGLTGTIITGRVSTMRPKGQNLPEKCQNIKTVFILSPVRLG